MLVYALTYLAIGLAWSLYLIWWDRDGEVLEFFGIHGLPVYNAAGLLWPVTMIVAIVVALVEARKANLR